MCVKKSFNNISYMILMLKVVSFGSFLFETRLLLKRRRDDRVFHATCSLRTLLIMQ